MKNSIPFCMIIYGVWASTLCLAAKEPLYPKGNLEGIALQCIVPEDFDSTKYTQNKTLFVKKVFLDTIVDLRENPQDIGINLEKSPPRKITTRDTLSVFVKENLGKIFSRMGVKIVADSADADIFMTAVLKQFFVTESNEYSTKIAINVTFKNHAGEKLIEKIVNTETSRWGKSYNARYYFLSISEALVLIAETLLGDQGVRELLK